MVIAAWSLVCLFVFNYVGMLLQPVMAGLPGVHFDQFANTLYKENVINLNLHLS